uniref:Ovule protein n=1 Tax=Syphacia muris TaxID=451379 RepID=A0A158R3R1_9BILA
MNCCEEEEYLWIGIVEEELNQGCIAILGPMKKEEGSKDDEKSIKVYVDSTHSACDSAILTNCPRETLLS